MGAAVAWGEVTTVRSAQLCSWRMTVHEIHSPKEPSHGAYVRAYTGMCVWYEIMRGTSFHSRAMYL